MPRTSAGILLYRRTDDGSPEVFLVHPGGPFWAKKDEGAWSIPKGEFLPEEAPLDAARREFEEETGSPVSGDFIPLDPVKQPGGKIVHAWAVEGDIDADSIRSNLCKLEWPRDTDRWITFPEVDRAAWFDLQTARARILRGQLPLIDQLERHLQG